MSTSRRPSFEQRDRLRKARETAGLDQQQLADAMGMSRNAVGMNERGEVTAQEVTLRAWSAETGVSLEWLRNG